MCTGESADPSSSWVDSGLADPVPLCTCDASFQESVSSSQYSNQTQSYINLLCILTLKTKHLRKLICRLFAASSSVRWLAVIFSSDGRPIFSNTLSRFLNQQLLQSACPPCQRVTGLSTQPEPNCLDPEFYLASSEPIFFV